MTPDLTRTPPAPDSLTVTRNTDYTEVTLRWVHYSPTVQYQVERLTAVVVGVGDNSRIEYGDPVTFLVDSPVTGVDEYLDTTAEADKTYQYRIRARGTGATNWSAWSAYVFSGVAAEADTPSNVEISRDDDSVTISWTAPVGDVDNYTVQRQELTVTEGSSFFANVISFGNPWLPASSTTYTDASILPDRVYEYRVAAVFGDAPGDYTEWSRVTPPDTSLGHPPQDLRVLTDRGRVLDDRREFWAAWDTVDGADDYELQVLVYNVLTGERMLESPVVTDPTYFRTSYGRVNLRVRGRKLDDDLCGVGAYCLSEWSEWWDMPFTPTITVPSPELADDASDETIMDLRDDAAEVIEAVLEPSGATVDADAVIQFGFLSLALVLGGSSIALTWGRGMVALGVGMACAISVLVLFVGYRLFGIPLAWPVAVQTLVAVLGLFALVRQTGALR